MFLEGHFQNAYVTHDLDRAVEEASRRHGLKDWIFYDADMVLKSDGEARPASARVGVSWVGALQIELIQPVSGYVEPYTKRLPEDPKDASPRFHHIGLRRDDLEAMREELSRLDLPLAFEGGSSSLIYVYFDASASLGHYVEYVWTTPAGWRGMGWPDGLPPPRIA